MKTTRTIVAEVDLVGFIEETYQMVIRVMEHYGYPRYESEGTDQKRGSDVETQSSVLP